MDTFLKNKNFIPDVVIEEKHFLKEKGLKNLIYYLIIANIILIPITINKINDKINNSNQLKNQQGINIDRERTNNNTCEDICNYLELKSYGVVNIDVTKAGGKIKISNLLSVDKLEELGMNISSIELLEDGYYSVEVGNGT